MSPDDLIESLMDENDKLKAKLELAKSGLQHIKKNELWGVAANCDAVLKKLEED